VIFQLSPWAFHCNFSIVTLGISFHWKISIVALGISLQFFNFSLGYFNAIFQLQPWAFHCDFSIDTQLISLQFFNYITGHFCIYTVYPMRHCIQVPCQGPLHILQKKISLDLIKKWRKTWYKRTLEIHVRSLIQKLLNLAIFLWTEFPKIPLDARSDMEFSKNLSRHFLRHSLSLFNFFCCAGQAPGAPQC